MDSLPKKNISLLIAGRLISLIGSSIQMIAIPLYILDKTGSGTIMGTFAMISMIPTLVVAPIAGVLGDRFNRKHIMVYADVSRGILAIIMFLLAFSGKMGIPLLLAGQIIISAIDSFFNSSSDGIIPDLVSQNDFQRVNAMKSIADSLSMIIGPVLGAVVYALGGIKSAYLINAISFLASALFEMCVTYKRHVETVQKLSNITVFKDVKEVVRFIMEYMGLKQLFTFAMAANFLVVPIFFVIMPYAFKKTIGFSSQQYGFLQASLVIGILIGNILLGTFFAKKSTKLVMKIGLVTQVVFLVVFTSIMFPRVSVFFGGATWTYFAVISASILLLALFNPAVNIPIQTNLQKMVDSSMRSRFFSVLGLFTQATIPVGSFVYGLLLDRVATHIILTVDSLVITVIVAVFLVTASNEVYEPCFEVENKAVPTEGGNQ
jgi:Arabinose efflux permease